MRWVSALSEAKTLPLALEETIGKIKVALGDQKPDLCLLLPLTLKGRSGRCHEVGNNIEA